MHDGIGSRVSVRFCESALGHLLVRVNFMGSAHNKRIAQRCIGNI